MTQRGRLNYKIGEVGVEGGGGRLFGGMNVINWEQAVAPRTSSPKSQINLVGKGSTDDSEGNSDQLTDLINSDTPDGKVTRLLAERVCKST